MDSEKTPYSTSVHYHFKVTRREDEDKAVQYHAREHQPGFSQVAEIGYGENPYWAIADLCMKIVRVKLRGLPEGGNDRWIAP